MALMIIISIILYAITIIMIHHNTYSFEKKKRLYFIIISLVVIFLFAILLSYISTAQIQEQNATKMQITRNASILLFAPIISMIILPFLGNSLNQYKIKKITQEQVTKRIIFIIGALILVAIIGVGYMENFQIGLLSNAKK